MDHYELNRDLCKALQKAEGIDERMVVQGRYTTDGNAMLRLMATMEGLGFSWSIASPFMEPADIGKIYIARKGDPYAADVSYSNDVPHAFALACLEALNRAKPVSL